MKKRFIIIITALVLLISLLLTQGIMAIAASGDEATTREELLRVCDNDYRSRTETVYKDINGKDVTVYGLYVEFNEAQNNPNFAQALMISQCMRYKEKYPERDVSISIQSFHFSVYLAACVDPANENYGKMKNLYEGDRSADGYVRLSALLVEAAKMGIDVVVVGQIDASPVYVGELIVPDFSFKQYFNARLSDDAVGGKKVSDYMKFGACDWTSYGDKSAADMMHNKTCTVSNYIDNDGVEHGAAIWTGSINLDGIDSKGLNGNNSIQTAVVITEHEELRRAMYNYASLMVDYCDQSDIVPFRDTVIKRTNEQMRYILSGLYYEIPENERILYLGTETDPVFELYFTPLGGDYSTWDTDFNPYAKYVQKLYNAAEGGERIELIWNNVKFNQTFEFADILVEAMAEAFKTSKNKSNILHLHLPGLAGTEFEGLQEGENIGYINVNKTFRYYHIKDLQLSYVENGQRQYITILNSLNFHEGSSYHQTNTFLVIKENERVGNSFYVEYATITTPELNLLENRIKAK